MKRIDDVEKLKKLIEPDTKYTSNYILSLIDSLAVEAPEAKPGAIEELVSEYQSNTDGFDGLSVYANSRQKDVEAARAELAQLQAEREEAIDIIKDYMKSFKGFDLGKTDRKAREYLRKVGI